MIFGRGTRGAGKALRLAGRLASRAPDRAEALRIRIEALNSFVADAAAGEAVNFRIEVSATLLHVAEADPEAALFLLANLKRHTPAGLTSDVDLTVLRAWARTAGPGAGVAWDAAASAVPVFHERLAAALAGAGSLSPAFRAVAVRRLVEWLDLETCGHLPEDPAALSLLTVLAPEPAPASAADWLCALGDLAADRGEREEAEARYRAAAAMGSVPARQRMAHLHAIRGSRSLGDGDLSAALALFQAAAALEPDPEYLTLLSLTRLLIDPVADENHLRDLPSGLRDFWMGVAAVLSGDHDHARLSLRRASGEQATVLLAAIDGEDAVLAGYARDLRDRHGADWAGRSLVGADPLVVAAARTDPGLLADLSAAKPELSEPALALAAHAVLTAAARSASAGDATTAVNRLRLAERMLES